MTPFEVPSHAQTSPRHRQEQSSVYHDGVSSKNTLDFIYAKYWMTPPVSHNHCTGVPSPWNFLKNLVMAIKTHVILHILAVNSNVLKLQRNSSMLRMHAKIVYIY